MMPVGELLNGYRVFGLDFDQANLAGQEDTAGGEIFIGAETFTMPSTALTIRPKTKIVGQERTLAFSTGQTRPHGLSKTPNRVYLSESTTGGALAYQSAPADATNIYITATTAKTYQWEAKVV